MSGKVSSLENTRIFSSIGVCRGERTESGVLMAAIHRYI